MGVKIQVAGEEVAKAPFQRQDAPAEAEETVVLETLEEAPPKKPQSSKPAPYKPQTWVYVPDPAHRKQSSLPVEWTVIAEAPKNGTVICVCCPIKDALQPGRYRIYDVQWLKPEGWNNPGWFVCGTAWHRLHDDIPTHYKRANSTPEQVLP